MSALEAGVVYVHLQRPLGKPDECSCAQARSIARDKVHREEVEDFFLSPKASGEVT